MSTHEQFIDEEEQEGPSNRKFGLTVGGILMALAISRFYAVGPDWFVWLLLAVGALLAALAAMAPSILSVPNRLWMGLGRVLFTVVNPLVMALMYFVCFAPVGFILRVAGHDPLHRRFDPSKGSYWVKKAPSEIDDPMKHQF